MSSRILMLAAAMLLATACRTDVEEECLAGACYMAREGWCFAGVTRPSPQPTCQMKGGEGLKACPSDGLVASCERPGNCERTVTMYFYDSYEQGDLVDQENACRNAGSTWTTY